MNANDFLISLGFDTKKLNKQIEDIQKKFEKIAVGVGVKSPAAARAKRKELSEAEKLEKTKARIRNQLAERERVKKVNAELGIVKEVAKAKVKEAKKVVQAEANAHIIAYQKAQARLARKPKAVAKALPDMNSHVAAFQRQQMKTAGMHSQALRMNAAFDKNRSGKNNRSALAQQAVGAARGRGVDSGIANAFGSRISGAANVQQAKQYANILAMISTRLNALDSFKRAELLRIVDSGDIARLVHFNKQLGQTSNEMRRMERRSIGLATAQNGLNDSTRNLIREYASLYAIFAGVSSINEKGQGFEAANSAMLAATGTTQLAAQEMEYLDGLTQRLGLSLLDVSDGYAKFLFASKGKLPIEESRELFTNMAELGTTLGISKDRMKLSMLAIQQMMSMGKVSAAELRQQFAESMPGGVQLFADALGLTTEELFKQMEAGKLLSADVLPKVSKQMKIAANQGGALEKKLQTTRVAQGQFFGGLEKSADKIFKSGFGEGLAGLFRELTSVTTENDQSLKELGKTFNVIFRVIKNVIQILEPVLKAVIRAFGTLARTIEWLAQNPTKALELGLIGVIGALTLMLKKTSSIKAFGVALTAAFRGPLAAMISIIAIMDEVRAYFDPNVRGIFDNKDWTPEQSAKEHAKRNVFWGIGTDEDRKLAGNGSNSPYGSFDKYIRENMGSGYAAVAGTAANTGEMVLARFTDFIKRGVNAGALQTAGGGLTGALTVIIPVMLDGKEISREVVKDVNRKQQAQLMTSMPAGGQ